LDHEGIETELVNYYQNILSKPIPDRSQAISKITIHIPTLITSKQNDALMRPITIEEVDQAIKEMPVGNVSGPGGFTTYFFHHCWSMVREDVWKLVEESRTSIQLLSALNATFLTLIPKKYRVSQPHQIIPIMLCNVV